MRTLQSRLMVIMLALGLIPLGLSLLINGAFTEATLINSKHTEMRNFGNEIKRQLDQNVQSVLADLQAISTTPMFCGEPGITVSDIQKELDRLAASSQFCKNLQMMSVLGHVEVDTSSEYETHQDNTAVRVVKSGAPYVSRPLRASKGKPEVLLSFYYPVFDQSQKVVRVLKAIVSINMLVEVLQKARFGENGTFVLLDSNNRVLYHKDPTLLSESYRVDLLGETSGEYLYKDQSLLFDCIKIPKGSLFPYSDWTLIPSIPKTEAMVLVNQSRWTALLVATLSISITGIAGYFLARSISRPIAAASTAARSVASRNMPMRLDEEAGNATELHELAIAFNKMNMEVLLHKEKLEMLVDSRTRKYLAAQKALAATTAQLHAANEATKEGLFVVNQKGEVITANGQMEKIFDLKADELRNQPLEDIRQLLCLRFRNSDEFAAVWDEAMQNDAVTSETEWALVSPTPKTLSIYTAPVLSSRGEMISRLWMFSDITTQRLLEDSLRQAQKMEAVGRLAGGVAHDFNNLLQGILGNLFLVQQDPELREHDDIRRCVHSARSAGLRAAELVKGLLGFSRQTHLTLTRCNVNDVLEATQSLVRPTFDPRITISADFQEEIWGINADGNQIEQVIMNMIMNAKDAMPNGGNLMLTTRNVVIAPDRLELIPGSRPGEYVRVSVTDQGTGMSEEIRSKIFEPFFTTKEQGKGTGLGLATSFGIVQQHGGWINCDSVCGLGTTFHIFLPRNEVEEAVVGPVIEAPKPVGGEETILVVDDELVVRAVAEAILKKHGYKIISACDGEEALDKLSRHDGEIDLVLMDMTMPRLSGMDTFRHMRKGQAPNVPVVICSGYLVDLSGFAEDTGSIPNGFLQKPYDIDDMSRTVRRVLDEAAATKVR